MKITVQIETDNDQVPVSLLTELAKNVDGLTVNLAPSAEKPKPGPAYRGGVE